MRFHMGTPLLRPNSSPESSSPTLRVLQGGGEAVEGPAPAAQNDPRARMDCERCSQIEGCWTQAPEEVTARLLTCRLQYEQDNGRQSRLGAALLQHFRGRLTATVAQAPLEKFERAGIDRDDLLQEVSVEMVRYLREDYLMEDRFRVVPRLFHWKGWLRNKVRKAWQKLDRRAVHTVPLLLASDSSSPCSLEDIPGQVKTNEWTPEDISAQAEVFAFIEDETSGFEAVEQEALRAFFRGDTPRPHRHHRPSALRRLVTLLGYDVQALEALGLDPTAVGTDRTAWSKGVEPEELTVEQVRAIEAHPGRLEDALWAYGVSLRVFRRMRAKYRREARQRS